jgi:NADH:ubiquinone oxidoreductase subunit 6 (subunit J)
VFLILAIFFSLLIWGTVSVKKVLQRLWPSGGLGTAVGTYLLLVIVAQAGITVSYFFYFGEIDPTMWIEELGLDLLLVLWFPLAAAAILLLVGAVVYALRLKANVCNCVVAGTSFALYFRLLMYVWSCWQDELARLARLVG